jgi:hypothetical protein
MRGVCGEVGNTRLSPSRRAGTARRRGLLGGALRHAERVTQCLQVDEALPSGTPLRELEVRFRVSRSTLSPEGLHECSAFRLSQAIDVLLVPLVVALA